MTTPTMTNTLPSPHAARWFARLAPLLVAAPVPLILHFVFEAFGSAPWLLWAGLGPLVLAEVAFVGWGIWLSEAAGRMRRRGIRATLRLATAAQVACYCGLFEWAVRAAESRFDAVMTTESVPYLVLAMVFCHTALRLAAGRLADRLLAVRRVDPDAAAAPLTRPADAVHSTFAPGRGKHATRA